MLKDRRNAANAVARQLFDAEAAIDDALVKVSTLVTVLTTARATAKLSSVVGNEAFAHVGAAVTALVEGRSSVVALHHQLDEVKNGIGLRNFPVVGTGDAGKILPQPTGENDAVPTIAMDTAAA